MAKKSEDTGIVLPQRSAPQSPVLPGRTQNDVIPPRFFVVQGSSRSLLTRGAKAGQFWLDLPDRLGGPRALDSLRVHLVDGDLPMRVMFPYDTKTGQPIMGKEDNSPWCGSNDGATPRRSYWGQQYIDYRNQFVVTINEGFADPRTGQAKETVGCAMCPLGAWNMPVLDEKGERVLNEKGGKATKSPPCQESPAFVFYAVDLDAAIMIQASSFTVRAALAGHRPTKRPGVDYYYRDVIKLPDGSMGSRTFDGKNAYPLIMSTEYVPNNYSGAHAPKFDVSPTPYTEEEYARIYGTEETPGILQMYHMPIDERGFTVRDYLTGAAYGTGDDNDDPFADSGPALESGSQIDPEKAARLLGNGGNRRIASDDPF